MDAQTGWDLVRRTLRVVQGHPKLLELADGQAEDPEQLAARLDEADQAWAAGDVRLGAFFDAGKSDAAPGENLRVLEGWTRSVAAGLPEAAGLPFGVLCCLEEPDRNSVVLSDNWEDIWRRLERPGDPSALDEPLAMLAAKGLVNLQDSQADQAGQQERMVSYRIHPGVAAAGQATTGKTAAAAVDRELAAYRVTGFRAGLEQETGEASGLVVRAGLAAAPYLLRQHDWAAAGSLLDQALHRDRSMGTAAAILPLLRRITQATTGTQNELVARRLLALALMKVQRGSGESELRTLLKAALISGRPDQASIFASDLINLLQDTGRLEEALTIADQQVKLIRQAALGPWTQLGDQAQRLQLLHALGHYEEVLAQVQEQRQRMASLPTIPQPNDSAVPWNVRETIHSAGVSAARDLGRWEEALTLNAEVATSKQARDAPQLEQARTWFNDYSPLLQLGRTLEARDLLHAVREMFASHHDLAWLAKVAGALADTEYRLGHRDTASTLAQDALRLSYTAGDPNDIAASHHNLATYLGRASREPRRLIPRGMGGTTRRREGAHDRRSLSNVDHGRSRARRSGHPRHRTVREDR